MAVKVFGARALFLLLHKTWQRFVVNGITVTYYIPYHSSLLSRDCNGIMWECDLCVATQCSDLLNVYLAVCHSVVLWAIVGVPHIIIFERRQRICVYSTNTWPHLIIITSKPASSLLDHRCCHPLIHSITNLNRPHYTIILCLLCEFKRI